MKRGKNLRVAGRGLKKQTDQTFRCCIFRVIRCMIGLIDMAQKRKTRKNRIVFMKRGKSFNSLFRRWEQCD